MCVLASYLCMRYAYVHGTSCSTAYRQQHIGQRVRLQPRCMHGASCVDHQVLPMALSYLGACMVHCHMPPPICYIQHMCSWDMSIATYHQLSATLNTCAAAGTCAMLPATTSLLPSTHTLILVQLGHKHCYLPHIPLLP